MSIIEQISSNIFSTKQSLSKSMQKLGILKDKNIASTDSLLGGLYTENDWSKLDNSFSQSLKEKQITPEMFKGRLARAGYITDSEKVKGKINTFLVFLVTCLSLVLLGYLIFNGETGVSTKKLLGIIGVSLYISITSSLLYLKYKAQDRTRQIIYEIPLFLENIILLAESGMGILPALREISENESKNSPLMYYIKAVYQLSANGIPFSQALSKVADVSEIKTLSHFLLHLDISSSEGGELIPSLRHLANFCHNQWRISVEERVKKLENIVVFPVFVAVIGLGLLITSVPMASISETAKNMKSNTVHTKNEARLGSSKNE